MKKGSLERRRTFSVGQFILTALMLLLAATMLVPILNIVANSFSDPMKSPGMSGLRIIPDGFSLLNYQIVLSNTTILPALFNSVKITRHLSSAWLWLFVTRYAKNGRRSMGSAK